MHHRPSGNTWIFMLIFIFCLFAVFVHQNSKGSTNGPITQIKNSCFAGARVLAGAVEMYDMDHATATMKILDGALLFKQGYIKSPIHGVDPDCSFEADLTGSEPMVWCVKHGTSASPTLLTQRIFAEEMGWVRRIRRKVERAFRF